MPAGDAQRLYAEGVALHKQGRVAEAAEAYARACAADPTSVAAHFNRAVALHALGRAADAEAAYRRALALKPDLVQALNNLANLLVSGNRLAEATELLRNAIAAAPEFAPPYNNLGDVLQRRGLASEAAELFARALALDANFFEARINLGKALLTLGRAAQARPHFEALLATHPDDAGIRFLRDAAAGAQPARPPDAYVARLFDDMAADFDRHLVEDLGYRMPERIADVVGAWLDARPRPRRIVDLGCGTGLAGERLRGRFEDLAGVDLSPKMVELARARGLYSSVEVGELVAFLARRPAASADLIIAADVFVYLGDLAPAFAQAARIAAPGARLVFTVESGADAEGFRLESTTRYVHGDAYVHSLAAAHGFDVIHAKTETMRAERGKPVSGCLYVLAVAVTPA